VGEERSPVNATGLVHPLVRSAASDREAYLNLLSHIDTSIQRFYRGELPGITAIPTSLNPVDAQREASGNFTLCLELPFLSKLMRSKRCDVNLDVIMKDIKKESDVEELSSEESEADTSPDSANPPGDFNASPHAAMRIPARSTMSPTPFGRPGSSKGLEAKSRKTDTPLLSPYAVQNHNDIDHDQQNYSHHDHESFGGDDQHPRVIIINDRPSMIDLSPNTVASNNAPSLVSDDDEDGDDGKSSLDSEAEEEEDSDVAEISIEDNDEALVTPRSEVRQRMKKEERHVTFVSPVKDSRRRR